MTPPPPPNTLTCAASAVLQKIDHVFEEFDVAALVAGNGNALGVFLDGGIDNFLDRAVVARGE
jgi:hypothetical protein